MSASRNVYLSNVHQGKGLRARFTYGRLYDADTGELMIAATTDYIHKAIRDRGLTLVPEPIFSGPGH